LEQYHELVKKILTTGNYKPNRTGIDTISTFGQFYKIDLSKGFPLLTTKDLSGFRWNSLMHELIWYFSGEEHIRNLREHTKIWDDWATEKGNLPTAYGRFWRRYPLPDEKDKLDGEWWPFEGEEWIEEASEYYDEDEKDIETAIDRWVTEEENGRKVFDQLQYVIDTINGDHPYRSKNSRRLIVNAWHPGNAAVSKLPPCHYTFVFNVQDGKLNTHLTQRSADTALGVPFNIAAYAAITKIVAQQTGLELGEFAHTLVDAHIYCGEGERGEWYSENLDKLQEKLKSIENREQYLEIKEWILENAPEEKHDGRPKDHIPGLLEQLSRTPRERPKLEVGDTTIDDIVYEDLELKDYNPYPGIKFGIAE